MRLYQSFHCSFVALSHSSWDSIGAACPVSVLLISLTNTIPTSMSSTPGPSVSLNGTCLTQDVTKVKCHLGTFNKVNIIYVIFNYGLFGGTIIALQLLYYIPELHYTVFSSPVLPSIYLLPFFMPFGPYSTQPFLS